MDKELFGELVESLNQAVKISKGELKPSRVTMLSPIDVLEVRQKLKLSRSDFAAVMGVSERTLESWEQGRRKPTGAARTLLRVAARHPRTVLEALRQH